ncbi:MAG: hypothetical protein F4Z13_07020 [Candidatus Dadabacteria bacterium]|nr:hypothetical protein [Candidatus Dadabacteria bacterium]
MKHVKYFDDFLKEKVNLNQSRLDTLDQKVEAVTNLLKSKLAGYRKYSPQGSYAHKTIIKPVAENDEFDADILIFIKDEDFKPDEFQEDYVRKVYDVFKDNGNYKDIVHLSTRCVTIDYAGDFHLDVVPCVEYQGKFYVCNRVEKKYEQTDGDGYRRWFAEKNRITGNNLLRKVTRLLKFLRDHKSNYSIKSILLTTLLGNHVYISDEDSSAFSDLPQALKTLSNRINDFLKNNPQMPIIENPVLPGENFNRNWDETKYKNFREKFNLYNTKIDKAFEEKDHNESVKLWREVFGDDFGKLQKKPSSGAAAGGLTPIYPTKPYASHETPILPTIEYTPAEMEKIRCRFPGLYYDKGAVRGEISFSARYELSGRKKKKKWIITNCSSGKNCIQDVYEIKILLNGQPKVFEVGGRIKKLAEKLGRPIVDLHLFPEDESCCLGIFLINERETLSNFVINKVYPYFVWQAYFEKFGKTPPCGEYSHGEQGKREFLKHVSDIGRNDPCPCGSGLKFKICCHSKTKGKKKLRGNSQF